MDYRRDGRKSDRHNRQKGFTHRTDRLNKGFEKQGRTHREGRKKQPNRIKNMAIRI